MTDHTHSVHVEGCYRCALSRDEVTGGQRVSESVLAGLEWHLSEFPADDFDGHRLTTADLVDDLRAAREENQRLQGIIDGQKRDRLRLDAKIAQQRVSLAAENGRNQVLRVKIKKATEVLGGGPSD